MARSNRLDDLVAALAGKRCVVALSGGADSAALAWLTDRHAGAARAVHVHHGGRHSDDLAAAAAAIAAQIGMRLDVVRVTVPAGGSPEGQARAVRYEALQAQLGNEEFLLTAHTADDDAETVLMHLARGSGLAGLAGIPAVRGRLLRPLLGARRRDLRALAAAESLPFLDDPANADPAITRNRVRVDVMPILDKALGVDPVPGMARSATFARLAHAQLEALAAVVPVRVRGGVAGADLARLAVAAPIVRQMVLRRMVSAIRGPYPPTAAETDRLERVATGLMPVTELADGCVATRSRTALLVGRSPGPRPVAEVWVGDRLEFDGWVLRRREVSRPTAQRLTSAYACVLPVVGDLIVRTVEPRDRIPIGSGRKLVQAAIAEAGIAPLVRSRHPVVISGDRIVWIPGVRAISGWEERSHSGYLSLSIIEEGPWT